MGSCLFKPHRSCIFKPHRSCLSNRAGCDLELEFRSNYTPPTTERDQYWPVDSLFAENNSSHQLCLHVSQYHKKQSIHTLSTSHTHSIREITDIFLIQLIVKHISPVEISPKNSQILQHRFCWWKFLHSRFTLSPFVLWQFQTQAWKRRRVTQMIFVITHCH